MSYRTGKSYRRRRPRIHVANPAAHRIRGRINQLRREIEQAQATADWFENEPVGLGEKKARLEELKRQLKGVTQ